MGRGPARQQADGVLVGGALARAIVALSDSGDLPLRFVAGADAMAGVEENLTTIRAQIDAHRALSAALSYDS